MLIVSFLRKKAVQETSRIRCSMIHCVSLPKKCIRSGAAVRGGDSHVASRSDNTVTVQMGQLLPSDKK